MKFNIRNDRYIGDGEKTFIIAEIGNNHQGKVELAEKAIDVAYNAGADAVSFQYAPLDTYCINEMKDHSNLAFLKECEFTIEQLEKFSRQVHEKGMAFSINVEDKDTLDKVINIGIDFIKLCSADLTNTPFVSYSASKNLPIFFSTGAAYIGEIERAFNVMVGSGLHDFVIYHTNSGYPTDIKDANILQMELLHEIFGGIKGYCDHTVDIIPPVVAVSRGAKVIEKHITTDRNLKGDDWMVSLEPEEFKTMVSMIRQAELCLGTRNKKPLESESRTREFKRKSIVSGCHIPKDTVFEEKHFKFKLPGTGFAPFEMSNLIGKKAACHIEEDVVIERDMIL
jgi:N,N'-diacetyllegionaminate synthase